MLGRIMVAIGGLIVVVLFAALLAPYVVNWSVFRVEFEDQASRMLGKKVSVHGQVDARILPFPSITLHDVRVGQDLDGQPQAQAARFSMDMELAPFLSGEARIFDMRIEEPKARIRVLKDGTLDWMRGSRPSIPTRVVVIEDVNVSGGSLSIIDEQSGRTREITGLSADMSAASLFGPWRGEGNATLDGQEGRFSLITGSPNAAANSLPLRLRLWPDAEPLEVNLEGNLALVDNVPTYSGAFSANILEEEDESEPVAAPTPRPRVKGSFELTNDSIRVADYRLEVGALDDPYVVTGEATLDTGAGGEFLLTAEGQQIDINRLAEGSRGANGKTGRTAATSAQRRLQVFVDMVASIPIPQVPGRASVKLPAVVLNDTTIRDIQLDLRPAGDGWTVDKAVATLPGRTRMETHGELMLQGRPSFVGDMLFASTQPSGLADWLSGNVDPVIRQLGSAGFSSRVNLTSGHQRFDDLELAIGAATLRGRVERVAQAGQVPQLSVNLAGDEIDLDAMRALASLITGDDAGMDVLDHRLEADLKAQKLTAFGVSANDVSTAFSMAGGALSIERLAIGNLAGARITAEGKAEGSLLDYRGNAKARLQAADMSAFLAVLKRQLPAHPALDRLVANVSYYADTDLTAEIAIGEGNSGMRAAISGAVNGSSVTANVDLPTIFDLTSGNSLTAKLSADNPRSEILLGQAGLQILPFGGDGAGTLALDINQPADGRANARLHFSTERTQLEADGNLSLMSADFAEGQGNVALNSRDIEPYLLLTGIGIPQFGAGLPVDIKTKVEVSKSAIQLSDLDGQVADNRFKAGLSIDRAAPSFKATGALDADSIDLAWLAEAVLGPLTDPASGEPAANPFGLPVFGESDVSLDLKAKRFDALDLGVVDGFSGKLVHRSGGLTIDEMAGAWKGGSLAGRLMLSTGGGTGVAQARLKAENIDLSQLVWTRDSQPVLTGRASFEASTEASGDSVRALVDGASGSGELRIVDLVAARLNPDLLAAVMRDTDGTKGEAAEERIVKVVAGLLHQGRMPLGDVSVPFTVSQGELRIQNVAASLGGVALSVEGRNVLRTGEMSASVSATYDPEDEAVAGGEPTVRLLYSGDLSEPRETLDVSALANFLTMRAYEQERRRVEMLQSSVLEKQRLRREVSLYNFRAAERAAEKARLEEEERARVQAKEAAEAAERARQQEINRLELDISPSGENFNPGNSPSEPFGGGSLPGVGQ